MSERYVFILVVSVRESISTYDFLISNKNLIVKEYRLDELELIHEQKNTYNIMIENNINHLPTMLKKVEKYHFIFFLLSAGYPESIEAILLDQKNELSFANTLICFPS